PHAREIGAVGVPAAQVAFAARLLEGMPNVRAGIATVANWCCSGVSEGGRVTFTRLRDAGAARLTDSGARLLGAGVATRWRGWALRKRSCQLSRPTWQGAAING